jgi:hypothetical protein
MRVTKTLTATVSIIAWFVLFSTVWGGWGPPAYAVGVGVGPGGFNS